MYDRITFQPAFVAIVVEVTIQRFRIYPKITYAQCLK